MHPIFLKTLGGLSRQYYLRQFFFGLLFPVMIIFIQHYSTHPIPLSMILLLMINSLFYPYARFVYESIVNFIMGDNVFIVNAALMLFIKLMTMAICWCAAIFIAPVGLVYLYYHHSKAENDQTI